VDLVALAGLRVLLEQHQKTLRQTQVADQAARDIQLVVVSTTTLATEVRVL
jgi:hypothetical protein